MRPPHITSVVDVRTQLAAGLSHPPRGTRSARRTPPTSPLRMVAPSTVCGTASAPPARLACGGRHHIRDHQRRRPSGAWRAQKRRSMCDAAASPASRRVYAQCVMYDDGADAMAEKQGSGSAPGGGEAPVTRLVFNSHSCPRMNFDVPEKKKVAHGQCSRHRRVACGAVRLLRRAGEQLLSGDRRVRQPGPQRQPYGFHASHHRHRGTRSGRHQHGRRRVVRVPPRYQRV